MRHDWVFEVLGDLAAYADANGLPRLARTAREAIEVARSEIEALAEEDGSGNGGPPLH